MKSSSFQAYRVRELPGGGFQGRVEKMDVADLPPGDVLIRVHFSSLNYKDALSATGNRGVTRNYPHTPGIDAAGIVVESQNSNFQRGDAVIVTSFDLGMDTDGGFGQYVRVPGEWVLPLPNGLTLEESMVLGTAGFTAAMCVEKIIPAVSPNQGPVLVTGATGGVGSLACAILVKLGYAVTAVSGKADPGFLNGLGVSDIVGREAFLSDNGPPVLKGRWAAVVDTVGGDILATAIKSTRAWGVITCCGLVASPEFSLTVFPFILRGLSLFGMDSQHYPMAPRRRLWRKLAGQWKPNNLASMGSRIPLGEVDGAVADILAGKLKGRTLVDLR